VVDGKNGKNGKGRELWCIDKRGGREEKGRKEGWSRVIEK
jgi:hypothetical protein